MTDGVNGCSAADVFPKRWRKDRRKMVPARANGFNHCEADGWHRLALNHGANNDSYYLVPAIISSYQIEHTIGRSEKRIRNAHTSRLLKLSL